MNKLENASSNLKEILMAIADGEEVQVKVDDIWRDFLGCHVTPYGKTMLKKEWRIKPDAFEDAWRNYLDIKDVMLNKEVARHFWDAAMEHKDDG